MFRGLLGVALACALTASHLRAVEMDGSYDTTAPTDSDISGWDSGWGESGVTGWDYVGSIGGASGVYLGNGWVLTAGHVGAGTFILNSGPAAGTYYYDGVSDPIANSNGTADLTLFQLTSSPDLPALSLATSNPSSFFTGRREARWP